MISNIYIYGIIFVLFIIWNLVFYKLIKRKVLSSKLRNDEYDKIKSTSLASSVKEVYKLGGNPIYPNSKWIDVQSNCIYKIIDVRTFEYSNGKKEIFIIYKNSRSELKITTIEQASRLYHEWLPIPSKYQ